MGIAKWLRTKGVDLPKHVVRAAANKAAQAAKDKRARRKARPQGARP